MLNILSDETKSSKDIFQYCINDNKINFKKRIKFYLLIGFICVTIGGKCI